MINFKKELNKEQLQVIEKGDGPCLVLAGAGSGKTRTITYRVAHLLEQGVQPDEILLVTFTNKAAREMISRVQQLTGGEIKLPWSGTFHHVAFRILKLYAPLLGYNNNFTILDSGDAKDLLKLCLKQEGIDRKAKRFPSPKVIMSILSFARNAERTIEDVLDEKHPKWLEHADVFGRIAEEYAKRKKQANAMDFDDLLVNLRLLLTKSPPTRKKYEEQFTYVLVDEYQDTNKVQASIIDLFASVHKNILVVGDDAQSIYSFRAADIKNILEFEKRYPDAQVYRLETNYRSTPEILAVANDVIANNRNQYEKELRSVQKTFIKPEVHAFADNYEEAEFIAKRILELRDEGIPLREMSVLFRASFHSQALEVELVKRDIPYEYRGGVRFFERSHIKDVLSFLRVYHNPDDEIAWSRVLHMQVGLGPATVGKILASLRSAVQSLMDDPTSPVETRHAPSLHDDIATPNLKPIFDQIKPHLSSRAQIGFNDFIQIWNDMTLSDESPAGLIRAVAGSKYAEYLESEYPDYRDREQDIEQFATFAERATDLHKFLAEITLQESFTIKQAQAHEKDDEKMVLSTIHQAKGLEWQAVFVLHVAAGQFPNDRALSERRGIEEERRLFYVAVTRAKKHLHLTYPLSTGRSMIVGGPSLFLEELDKTLLDMHTLGGSTFFVDPSDDVDDVIYVAEEDAWQENKRSFLKSIDDL